MMKEKKIKMVVAAVLLAAALISFFGLSKTLSDPKMFDDTVQYLDDRKVTVLELTAALTAASAVITSLPGDTATPIAEELADLSSGFLFVLGAIYLEKYLVTIIVYVSLRYIIPAALILFIVSLFWKREGVTSLAKRLLILAVAMSLVIPAGIKVSEMIENVYEESFQETITAAESVAAEVQKDQDTESEGYLSKITAFVKEKADAATNMMENLLGQFVDALAVLIVTSCVIPVLVLLFFLWIVKIIIGVDIPIPKPRFRVKSHNEII